jgi:hypothetical protein
MHAPIAARVEVPDRGRAARGIALALLGLHKGDPEMNKLIAAGCFALALGTLGCMEAPDAPALGATEHASTIFDDCATWTDANASEFSSNVGDGYTRSQATINNTCGCADWQVDQNLHGTAHANAAFPDCRPTTIVDFSLASGGRQVSAEVPGWTHLVNGKTECLNSTFEAKLQKFNWGTGAYDTIASSGLLHPTWSSGACDPLLWVQDLWIGVGGSGDYRMRARATRGMDEFNHGYETVNIRVRPWN